MSKFPQYMGMGYEQASREGARLIAKAHKDGDWFSILDALTVLRGLMAVTEVEAA